jgi:hypothetical protein
MADIDDDGLLRAFGTVALDFSELEEQLVHYTAKLINPADDGIGHATLAGLDFGKILDIFDVLVRERTSLRYRMVRHPPWEKAQQIEDRLKPLVLQITTVQERRNHVFHAYWRPHFTYDATSASFTQTPGAATSIRHKKQRHHGHVEKATNWTLEELQTLSAQIKEAARELGNFVTWANALVVKHKLFPEDDY